MRCKSENTEKNTNKIISVKELGVKRPVLISNHELKDNIKIDLIEMGCEDVDWIRPGVGTYQWWAVVDIVMNLQDP